jgi:hypothetical protein
VTAFSEPLHHKEHAYYLAEAIARLSNVVLYKKSLIVALSDANSLSLINLSQYRCCHRIKAVLMHLKHFLCVFQFWNTLFVLAAVERF